MSAEKRATTGSRQQNSVGLVLENFNEEAARLLVSDLKENSEESALMKLLSAISATLRQSDLGNTRLIITGDLVASVNSREDRTHKKFTTERGAGVVAAKTMPPNSGGIVDILVPSHWVLPLDKDQPSKERDEYIEHIAAHEAVHASIFHINNKPFELYQRSHSGFAMQNFLSMAGKQIEEHLAEYLGSKTTGRKIGQTADQVKASISAWRETLDKELPAIPKSAPDYFQQGMSVSLESLHILWKSLAYLAAALRNDDKFDPVPQGITDLPEWQELIAPWWQKHLELLRRIPMTVDLDVKATDKVVSEMGHFLQSWADSIGFDFHDTDNGPYFRIKIWD